MSNVPENGDDAMLGLPVKMTKRPSIMKPRPARAGRSSQAGDADDPHDAAAAPPIVQPQLFAVIDGQRQAVTLAT